MPHERAKIQAVLFSKNKFTDAEAKAVLRRSKMRPIKPAHVTARFLRYRLIEPDYKRYDYRTHDTKAGVKMIVQIPKVRRRQN